MIQQHTTKVSHYKQAFPRPFITGPVASNAPPWWDAPKFSFNAQDQAVEWKQFYMGVVDYLEVLDLFHNQENETK